MTVRTTREANGHRQRGGKASHALSEISFLVDSFFTR